jgi:ferredoxin
MAIYITQDCINCGACEAECPNTAIYEAGASWSLAGKTGGEGDPAPSGAEGFWSGDFYYIVPDKCTECVGFHDSPQCVSVCPVDCCQPDPKHQESRDVLEARFKYLSSLK